MHQHILEKMTTMRLFGMKRAFLQTLQAESSSYTADELLSHLIEAEWDDRLNRKIERLTKAARFRYQANVEELLFEQSRNLDANLIHRLATCDYIRKGHNVLITGSTGVGKSFLVSALGHQACQLGFRVMYANLNRLFTQLKMAKADGTYLKKIERIEKLDLLILDDFGLKPIDHRKSHLLMDILEDRHAKRSTMVAAQVPVAAWHELISNATLADAILDRIVHQAHRIELKGESLRKGIPKN
jgi:DNA replication protein DnaC